MCLSFHENEACRIAQLIEMPFGMGADLSEPQEPCIRLARHLMNTFEQSIRGDDARCCKSYYSNSLQHSGRKFSHIWLKECELFLGNLLGSICNRHFCVSRQCCHAFLTLLMVFSSHIAVTVAIGTFHFARVGLHTDSLYYLFFWGGVLWKRRPCRMSHSWFTGLKMLCRHYH